MMGTIGNTLDFRLLLWPTVKLTIFTTVVMLVHVSLLGMNTPRMAGTGQDGIAC